MKSVRIFLPFLVPLLAAVFFLYTHCLKRPYVRVSSQRLIELLRMILYLSLPFKLSSSLFPSATAAIIRMEPTAVLRANETRKENGIEIYLNKTDQATKYVRPVLFHSLPTKTSLVTGRKLCFSYLHRNKDYRTNHYLSAWV